MVSIDHSRGDQVVLLVLLACLLVYSEHANCKLLLPCILVNFEDHVWLLLASLGVVEVYSFE